MKTVTNKYGKRIELPDSSGTQGEQILENVLDELGLNYKMQFSFDENGLRRKKYDAAVFNKSNELALLIEYDGQEHWNPGWFEQMGTRPERCKMHVLKVNLNEARYLKVALEKGIPVLRVSAAHQKILRDLILAYVWTFVDAQPIKEPGEISAVKMLDQYGWDFDYVEPSSPGTQEKKFLDERRALNEF